MRPYLATILPDKDLQIRGSLYPGGGRSRGVQLLGEDNRTNPAYICLHLGGPERGNSLPSIFGRGSHRHPGLLEGQTSHLILPGRDPCWFSLPGHQRLRPYRDGLQPQPGPFRPEVYITLGIIVFHTLLGVAGTAWPEEKLAFCREHSWRYWEL